MQPRPLDAATRAALIARAAAVPKDVRDAAIAIVQDVATRGDAALREQTARFDGADLSHPWLGRAEWDALAQRASAELVAAIQGNLDRIEAFHARQVPREDTMEVAPGIMLGRRPIPFARVACYVPGGRASYPSTVLMTVTPARLAGATQIIVVTPPRADGSIDPAVAYAAQAAGATHILRAGGAQAVAALAHGTENVPAVDAIVGPGNAYVTAAKQHVAAEGRVAIDGPAGPSEVLILADGADALPIALDMVAQAEHDPDAQSILVTPDAALASAVAAELDALVAAAPRKDIIEAALRDHGAILVAADWDDAVAFANDYAAEHLEIHAPEPYETLGRIRAAGSVFLGPHAPVPIGDYGSGTNHVLPTMGHARLRGGLCVEDFVRWITWQEATAEGLQGIADDIITLARAEGLHAHADAVERRLSA